MHQSQVHRSRILLLLAAEGREPTTNAALLGTLDAGRIYLFGSKGLWNRALIEHAQRVDARVALDLKQSAPGLCLH